MLATNDSGPLRHRYGTPRDLVIGVQLATTDGRLVKAGGNVVKNVAGYDLGKLVSGSFGSLAAIVSATFKLAPLPAASKTLVAAFGDRRRLAQAAQAIGASQLEPSAFDVHRPSAGSAKVTAHPSAAASASGRGAGSNATSERAIPPAHPIRVDGGRGRGAD